MTREDVIRQIVNREAQRRRFAADLVHREAPALYAAACQHFGTWATALEYAGVRGRRGRPARLYSRQRVRSQLRELCRKGHDLAAGNMMRKRASLYRAALQHFGSWQEALREAGINPEHVSQRAKAHIRSGSRQQMLEALRQREASGQSLNWTNVCLENQALALAAKNAYGTWPAALAAVGVDCQAHSLPLHARLTKEQVLAGIQQRYQAGQSLQVVRNYVLAHAARRYFDRWHDALLAAGVPAELVTIRSLRRWSKERIVEDIKLRQQQGKPLKYTRVREEDGALISASRRLFGSWHAALAAAGVETLPGA